jgi:hypothetical protein
MEATIAGLKSVACSLLVFIDDAIDKLMQPRFVPSKSTDRCPLNRAQSQNYAHRQPKLSFEIERA